MAKKLESFTVYAKVEIECNISIKADTFEDALAKSQTLKETDFVQVLDGYDDGKIAIKGIFKD